MNTACRKSPVSESAKAVSECSRRRTRPGLKGPAKGAGRGKTSLECNFANVHILLRQQLTRFGEACLFHELRMRQVVIRQPPLQRAWAYIQLLRDPRQRRMPGR